MIGSMALLLFLSCLFSGGGGREPELYLHYPIFAFTLRRVTLSERNGRQIKYFR